MQTSVTFKNIDPSDHLKAYVSDKLDRFDKYLDNHAEANVVLSVEKFRHIAEITIIGDRLNVNGKEETNDMYSAIDSVLDKIEKQIKKNKQKKRGNRSGSKTKPFSMGEGAPAADEEAVQQIVVKSIEYKPMDVEEAVLQLDLVNDNFIVFRNAKNQRVNVVYRRRDGNIGLIQPEN
jgi:putative sigma-54 modulation protein